MVKKNKKFLVLANLARGVGQVCVEKKTFHMRGFNTACASVESGLKKKKGGF